MGATFISTQACRLIESHNHMKSLRTTRDPQAFALKHPNYSRPKSISTSVALPTLGSASDGDEDGIVGLILLLLATEHDSPRPSWWEGLGKWAYASCRAFLSHLAAPHSHLKAPNGQPLLALKLGSCWCGAIDGRRGG